MTTLIGSGLSYLIYNGKILFIKIRGDFMKKTKSTISFIILLMLIAFMGVGCSDAELQTEPNMERVKMKAELLDSPKYVVLTSKESNPTTFVNVGNVMMPVGGGDSETTKTFWVISFKNNLKEIKIVKSTDISDFKVISDLKAGEPYYVIYNGYVKYDDKGNVINEKLVDDVPFESGFMEIHVPEDFKPEVTN